MKFKSLWKLNRFILLAWYFDYFEYRRLIIFNFEFSWKTGKMILRDIKTATNKARYRFEAELDPDLMNVQRVEEEQNG